MKRIKIILTLAIIIFLSISVVINLKKGNFKSQRIEIASYIPKIKEGEELIELDSLRKVLFFEYNNMNHDGLMLNHVVKGNNYTKFIYLTLKQNFSSYIQFVQNDSNLIEFKNLSKLPQDSNNIKILLKKDSLYIVRVLHVDSLNLIKGVDIFSTDSSAIVNKLN